MFTTLGCQQFALKKNVGITIDNIAVQLSYRPTYTQHWSASTVSRQCLRVSKKYIYIYNLYRPSVQFLN